MINLSNFDSLLRSRWLYLGRMSLFNLASAMKITLGILIIFDNLDNLTYLKDVEMKYKMSFSKAISL